MDRTVLWVLFALLLFALTYVHQKHFDSPTPVSRLNLLHALWQHGTFRIDAYHQNTPDKAVHQGHYYSDKAPGTVALALPGFVLAAGILSLTGTPPDSQLGWLASSWLACALSLGLLTAAGGVALFAWLCRWTSPRPALVTTAAIFLGAAPLPYATLMFSHALAVGLLAAALWAIDRQEVVQGVGIQPGAAGAGGAGRGLIRWLGAGRWDLLAGFACGWVVASEYTAGPRYLAPMLPLLALPCALGVARRPRVGMLLALVSVGLATLATLTDTTPKGHIHNPLTELHIPLLLRGEFSPNVGQALGLPPFISAGLYYLILALGLGWLWRRLGTPEASAAAGAAGGSH